jgi:hypothetical protein
MNDHTKSDTKNYSLEVLTIDEKTVLLWNEKWRGRAGRTPKIKRMRGDTEVVRCKKWNRRGSR